MSADLRDILAFALLAFVALLWLGFALGRLLFAATPRLDCWLWTPLLGFALATVVTAPLTVFTALTPVQILTTLVFLLAPINLLAWFRLRPDAQVDDPSAAPQLLLGAGLLMFVALAGALSPLLVAPLAPIGKNWDAGEFYLPLGKALMLVSQRDLSTLPENPLISTLTRAPLNVRVHAFSYLHAALSAWSGIEPLRSFTVLMAVLAALVVPAVVLLARACGCSWRAGLCAGALAALHSVPLWATYNGFAMHVTSFSLLPAALAATIGALDPACRTFDWRRMLAAMLVVGGLGLGYHPALTIYALWIVALLLFWLITLVRQRQELCAGVLRLGSRVLLLALGAIALSWPSHYFFIFGEGFRTQYLEQSPGMDIGSFLPLTTVLGFDCSWRSCGPILPPILLWLAAGLAVGLMLWTLWLRRANLLTTLWLASAAYLGLMIVIAYHYGFYKGVTFVVPMLAIGLVGWIDHVPARRGLRIAVWSGAGALLVAALLGWVDMQRHYFGAEHRLYTANDLAIVQARVAFPPESDVFVQMPQNRSRIFGGLVAYTLIGRRMWGNLPTGYNATRRGLSRGMLAELALLPAESDPAAFGYTPERLRWSGAGMRLYERDPAITFLHLLPKPYLLLPQATMTLALAPNGLVIQGEKRHLKNPTIAPRGVLLGIGSFEAGTLQIDTPLTRTLPISPGLTPLDLGTLSLPMTMTLQNVSTAPVCLWRVAEYDATAATQRERSNDALLGVTSSFTQNEMLAHVQLQTPRLDASNSMHLTAVLVLSYAADDEHFSEAGRWVFFPASSNQINLGLNLTTHAAQLSVDGLPAALDGTAHPRADGAYQASILLANNGRIVGAYAVAFWKEHAGVISDAYSDDVLCERVALPNAAQPLAVTAANAPFRLQGFTLAQRQLQRGAAFELTTLWQAAARPGQDYSAQVLLLDDRGQVALSQDLPLGAADYPSSRWQQGELGEYAASVALPNDLPPGTYTLALALRTPQGESSALKGSDTDALGRAILTTVEVLP